MLPIRDFHRNLIQQFLHSRKGSLGFVSRDFKLKILQQNDPSLRNQMPHRLFHHLLPNTNGQQEVAEEPPDVDVVQIEDFLDVA